MYFLKFNLLYFTNTRIRFICFPTCHYFFFIIQVIFRLIKLTRLHHINIYIIFFSEHITNTWILIFNILKKTELNHNLAWVNYVVLHLSVKKKGHRKKKRKEKAVCLSLIRNNIKVIRGGGSWTGPIPIPPANENKLGFSGCLGVWLRVRFTRSHTKWCLVNKKKLILMVGPTKTPAEPLVSEKQQNAASLVWVKAEQWSHAPLLQQCEWISLALLRFFFIKKKHCQKFFFLKNQCN